MLASAQMLSIKDDDLIGKGMMRACYQHPDSEDQCIKIFHKKKREENYLKEVKEMRRLSGRGGHSLVVPKYYGTVATNKGTGYVFELIRGKNGDAITLRDYLANNGDEVACIEEKLQGTLLESGAVFQDLNCGNILVLEEQEGVKFAVVDGLGEGAWFKICSFVPYFARRRLKRKWSPMAAEMKQLAAG